MLDILFAPKTVAIIGASSNPNKWGNWLAEQVIRHQHLRRVYFVNPKAEVIFSIQSFTSVTELPEPLDVAIVAVPAHSVESVVDDLLVLGTKILVVISAGFSEKDNKGFERERKLVEKVHKAGSLLIGPNCAGVWDSHSPFNCLPVSELASGCVGLISQSGGIINDVSSRLKEVKLGYSRAISTGNQAAVSISDMIANFDSDPNTKVIALYIENEQSVPYHVFKKTTKPIVLLTPETSVASRRATKYHTNSIPSNSFYVQEATTENGAYYARTLQEFVALIQAALSGLKSVNNKRTIIISDTGGLGVMATAAAEKSGLVVNVTEHIHANPIDLINIASGFSSVSVNLMRDFQNSSDVDAILMLLQTDNDPEQDFEAGLQLATCVKLWKKPTVFVVKDFALAGAKALLQENMPVYRDIETAVTVLNVLCEP